MWQTVGSKVVGGSNFKMLSNDLRQKFPVTAPLQEFVGESQISRLECFKRVWSYIKTNNLQVGRHVEQGYCARHFWWRFELVLKLLSSSIRIFSTISSDSKNLILKAHGLDRNKKSEVICDDKLKSIVQGKSRIDLLDLPMLIKAHFPQVPK